MKSLVIICCLAVALGVGVGIGCGPKNPYCPETNGECVPPAADAGVDISDTGPGEATIFE
jgi:hypothetical protein